MSVYDDKPREVRPPRGHQAALEALALLGGDEVALGNLGERKRNLRRWQAAHTLLYYGLWHEVRLDAQTMDAKTFTAWMGRRFPKCGHKLAQDDAAAGKFDMWLILPEETDW